MLLIESYLLTSIYKAKVMPIWKGAMKRLVHASLLCFQGIYRFSVLQRIVSGILAGREYSFLNKQIMIEL